VPPSSWPQAVIAFLKNFDTGARELLDLPAHWLLRSGELVERYRDLPLGLVDATVIAATEMLRETKVATLDRRHFTVIRPAHTPRWNSCPEPPNPPSAGTLTRDPAISAVLQAKAGATGVEPGALHLDGIEIRS
jgi:hypothetical protein